MNRSIEQNEGADQKVCLAAVNAVSVHKPRNNELDYWYFHVLEPRLRGIILDTVPGD